MIDSQEETKVHSSTTSDITLTPPKRYYVVMHNDNSTPFDFVIEVLCDLFNHDPQTAADLAHKIHTDEKAIVGMYNLEIAEQKIEETVRAARVNSYPLTVTLEPAE